jgi:hypothetical protein
MKSFVAFALLLTIPGQKTSGTRAPATLALPVMWEYSAPLISPEVRPRDRSIAQKDPTVVFRQGRWHVFMTVKLEGRTALEYCSFEDWGKAGSSARTLLRVTDSNYFGAPQVFYFEPHGKWYLIYQVGMQDTGKMWVAYSTTTNIENPASWTRAQPILDGGKTDPRPEGGLDYWIICDSTRAYLFFTSLNGKLWRAWAPLHEFPKKMGNVEVALQGPFYEASHTYRLKGTGKFLTIVEEDGRRYYKAYVADALDATWTPLAESAERPFAGWANIRPAKGVEPWTDNVSHGELIRDGADQTMTVDPANLRFVFQGMLEKDKGGKGYGAFQWRIGMLLPAR